MEDIVMAIKTTLNKQNRSGRRFRINTLTRAIRASFYITAVSGTVSSVLAADFGDAPLPYPTTVAENGAEHTAAAGPTLGNSYDDEADGTHPLCRVRKLCCHSSLP
jgi:hypothetical protein